MDSFLYDESNPDSVRSAIVSAFRNAVILRPELSSRLLQYIELAMGKIVDAARHGDAARDVYAQRDIADNMLAFWGGIENLPAEPTLKSLLFVGKYIERIDLYTRLGLSRDELAAPMRKLDGYLAPLGGDPVAAVLCGRPALAGRLSAVARLHRCCGTVADDIRPVRGRCLRRLVRRRFELDGHGCRPGRDTRDRGRHGRVPVRLVNGGLQS